MLIFSIQLSECKHRKTHFPTMSSLELYRLPQAFFQTWGQEHLYTPEWGRLAGPRTEQLEPSLSFNSRWLQTTLGEPHVSTSVDPAGIADQKTQVGLTVGRAHGEIGWPRRCGWVSMCPPAQRWTCPRGKQCHPEPECQHHAGGVPDHRCQLALSIWMSGGSEETESTPLGKPGPGTCAWVGAQSSLSRH